MSKNAVVPYAIVAVVGILLVIVMSVVGLNQQEAIQNQEQNGGEKQEQSGESGGGETASTDAAKIYENTCASCHGADLSGAVGPALNKVGSKYDKAEIKEIIKTGFPDAQPPMPGGLVQGAEADALAQWLSEKK
ncbi:cytochrome c550 [Virgibacillus doumboii]|uniref:cytochrome c550 n=1 Tax=Virgibacillus doumboii TaxID=2697503 RepID=UPI0013E06428|nr:cytochrome c [Virgibacillus doumboii]